MRKYFSDVNEGIIVGIIGIALGFLFTAIFPSFPYYVSIPLTLFLVGFCEAVAKKYFVDLLAGILSGIIFSIIGILAASIFSGGLLIFYIVLVALTFVGIYLYMRTSFYKQKHPHTISILGIILFFCGSLPVYSMLLVFIVVMAFNTSHWNVL